MRVKGTNIVENKHLSLGQSHTIDLALKRAFQIHKAKWDAMDVERLNMAANPAKSADLAVVVMEQGLAHLCLITAEMTITKAKVEKSIPRKRIGSSSRHDKAVLKFYDLLMTAIVRHIDFDVCKCVVLASPAFIKDDFFEHMFRKAVNTVASNAELRVLLDNKSKFMRVHCSNGHKSSIKQVLSDEATLKRLGDTKASEQTNSLNEFFKLLNVDESRAVYGQRHVEAANESQAIQTLMITDGLFRSQDLKKREMYVKIVESAKRNGADLQIFSSLHVSGEQLTQITGIAAILRFPMPELLELDDSDDDEDDEDEFESSDDDDDDEEEKRPF